MKYILFITFIISILTSCVDYEAASGDTFKGAIRYDGTVWDYLNEGDSELNLHFNTMVYVAGYNQALKNLLEKADEKVTLFAVSDDSFEAALKAVNKYRLDNNLGEEIDIEDIMTTARYEVHDTIVPATGTDTVFVNLVYDYPGAMDSLLCRYVITGEAYDSETEAQALGGVTANSSFYDYPMHISTGRLAAEGVVGAGVKYLTFSDVKNSGLKARWIDSDVIRFDIYATNGVIHILTSGHEFGFNEFISPFNNYGNEYRKSEE
jgi:hypothetical protein